METSDGGVVEGRGGGVLSEGIDAGAMATGPPGVPVGVHAGTHEV